MIVSPSLLSADFGNLARDIEMINQSKAQMLHLDVMDGVFVPNISFGFPVMKYVQQLCKKPLDVHLMIVEPQKFVSQVRDCGATPVCLLRDIVEQLDLVLLMSVNPGFGGQQFIPNTLNKVRELKALLSEKNSHAVIEVDGGVNAETGKLLAEAGADILVAGNYVFKAQDPIAAIDTLVNL